MNTFLSIGMAIAFVVPNPIPQDDDDAKFRAVLSKIPVAHREGVDWTSPAEAKAKTSTLFPWVRVYASLKSRYPKAVVVDLREEAWTFADGEPTAKWVGERLPKWVAESKRAIDTPERAREVLRFYLEFTEEPYRLELGEIAVEPQGDEFRATCTLAQWVPSKCDVRDEEGDLVRVIACSRKKITQLTLTLGRKGTISAERKEEPSKGCRHVAK